MSHDSEQPILRQIHDLVAEEHQLRSTHTGIGLNSTERSRLDTIERELDRCWDLLRHRRAAEEYGTDPDAARSEADTARGDRDTARDEFADADDLEI
ncbi:MAG TPA: DUF2630 family protein [Jatrophihabitans sp.]|jgi:hypothetical protein|nr:DUF2630 family protein [Jatrophihabitans sp.]